jgi:hypothetical protein
MAAGDPGSPARYYSSTAVETSLQSSIPAQAQGSSNSSFIVASVSGFPTSYPYTLIVDPDTSKEEVLTVTSGSSTTLVVTRGVDGTQAVAHTGGAVVRHGVSGRDFRESENHIAARGYDIDQAILVAANQTHVHGLQTGDGVVVGTDALQTLTRKTLSNPTITGVIGNIGITFEGNTADAHETTLEVVEPTQDNTITLPNTSGTVILNSATQTISNKTLGSNLNAGGYTVTNLATPVNASDAVRKDFADAQVAAAATSAASAATSASSAATSATSAAASAATAAASVATIAGYATSAANSASAAATSATSAATSATSSATSASAAASSATAAATSAASAATSATAAATSATSAAASATAAATSAASAATSATSAAASATTAAASVASIAGYAAAAATSEANALTSANSAATSATSAANSATASANSASAAATSATSAATSATSAAASATAAATSATSADSAASIAIAQASNASASASAAATSATSASNSASAAATSATSAGNSATAAAQSASSAAASATSAAASWDEFDDRYLGPKATAPTVDNDGNPLTSGVIYWNTTNNNMYAYDGSAWQVFTSSSAITNITASSPITGGGATSSVTISIQDATTSQKGAVQLTDSVTSTSTTTAATPNSVKQAYDLAADALAGLHFHDPVETATSSNITLSGLSAVNGYTPIAGDRILVKNQTTQADNGVYVAASGAWSRATDFDTWDEVYTSAVYTKQGNFAGESFITTVASTGTVGVTAITFALFATDAVYSAGTGLTLTGTTFALDTTTQFVVPSQTGQSGKYLTTDGTSSSWGTVASYSAPTLGSTTISSGSTVTTIVGMTKVRSDQFTTLDASGYEIDLELFTIMGAF